MVDNKLKSLEGKGEELKYSGDQAEDIKEQPLVNIEDIESTEIEPGEDAAKQEVVEDRKKIIGLAAVSNTKHKKAERKKKIEKILEKDMESLYLSMPVYKQNEFRRVGDEISQKINDLLDRTKIKIKNIINLIKKWLLIIPHINKYFLEQEAKIKADKILKVKTDEYK